MPRPDAPTQPVIVFDLGGVLIDWDPRHLYRKLFGDEAAMEWFLDQVCHGAWNLEQDRGRSFADAIEEAVGRHPDQRAMIEAYHLRWQEMLVGAIEESVAILEDLKDTGHELHALTNWSAETFPRAHERFPFLAHFATILVSGEERLIKPDPRIFDLLLERIGRRAGDCLFIDDNANNIAVAEQLGFDTILFQDPPRLRAELVQRSLLSGMERG